MSKKNQRNQRNKNGTGKGDRYRKVDKKLWDKNWERIFDKSKQKDNKKSKGN